MLRYSPRLLPSLLLSFVLAFTMCFTASATVPTAPKKDVSVKELLVAKDNNADSINEQESKPDSDVPKDEFRRGQPRSAMAGYLQAARAHDFITASKFLDFRNISPATHEVGEAELARQLYVVLNRTLWVDLQSISDEPLGELNEALPSYRDRVGKVDTPKGRVNILLQRVPREEDRVRIWKISNATVENIPLLFKHYSYSPFGEWLSKSLPAGEMFGVMLWQWVYFLALFLAYLLIAVIFTWLVAKLIKAVKPETSDELISFIRGPVALLLAVGSGRMFVSESNVTLAVQAVADGATVLIIAWIWLFFRMVDLVKSKLAKRFVAQDKPLAVYLLRPAGTVIKSLIVVIGVLIWFENLGFSATTLLTGLGIGGLAIALAAQKTVENIIGAITLYTSAPVKIGNFCRFGTRLGVVEEIGLRATRIRTIERTVIHIANAQFVDMQLENFSERERIAYRPQLKLTVDSKKEDVENFMADFKQALQQHELVQSSPCRVYLKGFTTLGLELYVLSYIDTLDYETYLSTTNDLNLTIMNLLQKHHCQLVNVQDFKAEAI